jgi:anti-sigma B factor antagonist
MMKSVLEIIKITSSLDTLTGRKLVAIVNQKLQAGTGGILIDFEMVEFTDSAGLAALVTIFKATQAAGVRFTLCAIGSQFEMLLQITSMTNIFEIFPDRETFYQDLLKGYPHGAKLPDLETGHITEVSKD